MTDPTEIIIENGESVPTALPLATERQARRTRRKLLPKLLRVAGRIPFADDLAAAKIDSSRSGFTRCDPDGHANLNWHQPVVQ
ncbi:MAG: hypothetical protein L3J02_05790 [Henriciella sp.]|nr:hypothetical protein [Henriciella sp.]